MDTPAIAAPDTVSLVFAGGAPIDSELFVDLMDDWTRYTTDKPVNVAVYLPAVDGAYTDVVDAARYWTTIDDGPGFGIVTGAEPVGAADRKAKAHVRAMITDKDKVLTCTVKAEETGASVAETLIMMLTEDNKEQQRTPYVILAWGAEKDAPDDFTWELRAQADQAGIPVLEIAAEGLQEMPPMEPEAPEETTEEGHVQLPLPEPDEAQTATVAPETLASPEEIWPLAETVDSALTVMHGIRLINIGLHGNGAGESPLLRSLAHHSAALAALGKVQAETPRVEVTVVTPEPAPEPEKEPPAKRGRSRTPVDKIAVFLSAQGVKDIESGFMPGPEDIKLAVGRPRAGWVRQQLTKDQVPASLLAA